MGGSRQAVGVGHVGNGLVLGSVLGGGMGGLAVGQVGMAMPSGRNTLWLVVRRGGVCRGGGG